QTQPLGDDAVPAHRLHQPARPASARTSPASIPSTCQRATRRAGRTGRRPAGTSRNTGLVAAILQDPLCDRTLVKVTVVDIPGSKSITARALRSEERRVGKEC